MTDFFNVETFLSSSSQIDISYCDKAADFLPGAYIWVHTKYWYDICLLASY